MAPNWCSSNCGSRKTRVRFRKKAVNHPQPRSAEQRSRGQRDGRKSSNDPGDQTDAALRSPDCNDTLGHQQVDEHPHPCRRCEDMRKMQKRTVRFRILRIPIGSS